jgi:hypothetical protein
MMPAKQARFDDALVSWYENAAKNENAIRLKKGLKPLAWVDLLRVVAERFAGLPASHDVDLEGAQRRAKRAAKKSAAKNAPTTSDMTTPPHGGKTAAKKGTTTWTVRTKKRTAKKAPTASDRWTRPHGG